MPRPLIQRFGLSRRVNSGELAHVGSGIVRLDHVDAEAFISIGICQTVSDVALGLAITLDVLNIQIQDAVIVLQLGQVGSVQEVIGGVEDVQPTVFTGATSSPS